MPTVSKLSARFEELVHQIGDVEATKKYESYGGSADFSVDENVCLGWRVKVRNLLKLSCGEQSELQAIRKI